MQTAELEMKIFYAIKFIARPMAVPDQVVIDAAEAATREIIRFQKSNHQGASLKEEHHESITADSDSLCSLRPGHQSAS